MNECYLSLFASNVSYCDEFNSNNAYMLSIVSEYNYDVFQIKSGLIGFYIRLRANLD